MAILDKKTLGIRWWIACVLLAPLTFVMSLDRTAFVVASPTIQHEYHFSLIQMSFLLTSFYWSYALFLVPSGWLCQKFGSRKMLAIASLFWSALTALIPMGAGLLSFAVIRSLLGAGQSADWPASILAIKQWFPPAERAKANSVLLGSLYLGPIFSAPITTVVILHFGWHWAFYGFGAAGVLVSIAWWIGFRDRPKDHPFVSVEEAEIVAAHEDKDSSQPIARALGAGLKSSQFWILGIQYFFLIMIMSYFTTWMPTYLVQERHLQTSSMGIYVALPSVALVIMVFVGGRLSDSILRRTGSIWRARVPTAIAGFIISSIALVAGSRSSNSYTMIALFCLSLGCIGLTQVSIWSTAQDLGRSSTGIVAGWTGLWGNMASVVGPVLTAYLIKWTGGWANALLIVAVYGFIGAVLWLFVRPQTPIAAFAEPALQTLPKEA